MSAMTNLASRSPPALFADNTVIEVAEFHSGPLPSARTLQEYDHAVPGLAQVIVDRAGSEMVHRHGVETRTLDARIADRQQERAARRHNQHLAFVLVLGLMMCGVYMGAQGESAVASIIFGTTVCSVAIAFVTGRAMQEPKRRKSMDDERPHD